MGNDVTRAVQIGEKDGLLDQLVTDSIEAAWPTSNRVACVGPTENEALTAGWSRDVARWFRCNLAVPGPFVCRCLNSLTMPRFHIPLIEPDGRV
jgi:hypothetical protein